MKKFLKTILFLCALSSIAYAEDDGMAILNKKRVEIEKAEKAKAKLEKEAAEKARKEAEEQAKLAEEQAKAQVVETVEVVEVPAEAVVATEALNPQDEQEAMEILDGMRKKIKKEDEETIKLQKEAKELGISTSEKLDFYERVVRSVAREEAEVAGYYEIMNDDVKTTEAIEQATPVEGTVQQQ